MALDFAQMEREMTAVLTAASGTEQAEPDSPADPAAAQEVVTRPAEAAAKPEDKPVAMVPSGRLREANHRAKTFESERDADRAELATMRQKYAELESRASSATPGTNAATAPSEATDAEWLDKLLAGRDPEDLSVKELVKLRKDLDEFKTWKAQVEPQLAMAHGYAASQEDARSQRLLDELLQDKFPGLHKDDENMVLSLLLSKNPATGENYSPDEVAAKFARASTPTAAAPVVPARQTSTPLPRVNAPGTATSAAAPVQKKGSMYDRLNAELETSRKAFR